MALFHLKEDLKMMHRLQEKTALIIINPHVTLSKTNVQFLQDCAKAVLIIPLNVKNDFLDIVSTITLKQVLNLISNITMIGLGKIRGNIIIDIALNNYKLIARAMRIVKKRYPDINERALYNKLLIIKEYKKSLN